MYREELNRLLWEEGYCEAFVCPEEEQARLQKLEQEGSPLPDDVFKDSYNQFMRCGKPELTLEDFRLLVELRRKKRLDAVFFVLVAVAVLLFFLLIRNLSTFF